MVLFGIKYNFELANLRQKYAIEEEKITRSVLNMLPTLKFNADRSYRSRKNASISASIKTGHKSQNYTYSSEKNIKTWGHPYPFDGGAMEKFVNTGEPTFFDTDGYNISYMIYYPPRSIFLGVRYNFR